MSEKYFRDTTTIGKNEDGTPKTSSARSRKLWKSSTYLIIIDGDGGVIVNAVGESINKIL